MSPLTTGGAGATPAHRPRTALVTGGAGFIGTNLVRHLLASDADLQVINLDALTYAGNQGNLAGLPPAHAARHRFVEGDICDAVLVERLLGEHPVDTIIHLAAESHVDRSLDGPMAFIRTNLVGTATLLDAARRRWKGRTGVRFHHVSTDEVYGSLGPTGRFREDTAYDPSSPYSASKAGSDHLVRAWQRSYGLPATITTCSNNYGPYHFPEKLIPLMITSALAGRPLTVYGAGANVRDWVYVEDHCRAIDAVVRGGRPGETYNVGGHDEWTNLALVERICDLLDQARPDPAGSYRRLITFVADRPGHDLRYALDAGKIARELGWRPRENVASGLAKTIAWYLANHAWVDGVRSGGYRGERLGLGAER